MSKPRVFALVLGTGIVALAGVLWGAGLFGGSAPVSAKVGRETVPTPPLVAPAEAAMPAFGEDGVGYEAPEVLEKTQTARRGDTLGRILDRLGISASEAHAAIQALSEQMDPRTLKAGQEITFVLEPASGPPDSRRLKEMAMDVEFPYRLAVTRSEAGAFAAVRAERVLDRALARTDATIRSSLFAAGDNAGLPLAVLTEIVRLYSWDVDFQRDVQPGDHFAVVYDTFADAGGGLVDTGDIRYASLSLSGHVYRLYRYDTGNGEVDYFNEKGQGVRKALLRTPIDGGRLSSRYGKRKHPILGYTRMHRGVDFAAPTGTPIYAAGDGVLDHVGRKGGYGKYVRIRHNQEFSTAYGHLSRYAKGMRRGVRVKQGQVVAYVGSTGRSTGPHLHYEILKNGNQTNPMTVKMPSSRTLKGEALERFLAHVTEFDQVVAGLAGTTEVAEATPPD